MKNTRSYVQLAWGCGRISEQPGLRLEDTTRVVVVVWKDVYAITVPCHSSVRRRRRRFQFARTYHPPMFLPGNKFRVIRVHYIRIYPMINTAVSVPVYQIYLRSDDNEGLRSKWKWKDVFLLFFFLPWIDPSFVVRRGGEGGEYSWHCRSL